jgi:selenocysteine lyase/cysteine desulfurase
MKADAKELWIDMVRENWPGISNEDADLVLWNATCFPFGRPDRVAKDLREMYARSNGNPMLAVAMAEADIEAEMKKYREDKKNAS